MEDTTPQIEKIDLPSSYIKLILRDKQGKIYAVDAWDNLLTITRDGSKYLIARQVDQVNYIDRLLFTKESSLYSYDTQSASSRLLYKDSGLNLSSITTHGRQLISMFATDGVSTSDDIYIFKLGEKDYIPSEGQRSSKLLSLYGDDDVQSVDYDRDSAQVLLKVPVISNKQTGVLQPVQPQYDQAKARVEEKIKSFGVKGIKVEYLP